MDRLTESPDLFAVAVAGLDAPEHDRREAAHKAIPNFYETVARRKLAAPDTWRWHALEVVVDDVLVTGAIPIGFKRNGDPKWPPRAEDQRVVVTKAEFEAEREAWTGVTGLCWNCGGCGQETAGWDITTGRRFRPCPRCKATP